jgi:hypothetical protein
MAYRVAIPTFLLAASLVSPSLAADADEKAKCGGVTSIGVATMTPDGVITLRVRSSPPGPIAEGVLRYTPGQADYDEIKQHLGGITPGESKPVPPWC